MARSWSSRRGSGGWSSGKLTPTLAARDDGRAEEQGVSAKYFGASVRRREDPALLTGGGQYVDDIKLPGMLHAAFLRSPHAHARIARIDPERARRLPGVAGVFTFETLTR